MSSRRTTLAPAAPHEPAEPPQPADDCERPSLGPGLADTRESTARHGFAPKARSERRDERPGRISAPPDRASASRTCTTAARLKLKPKRDALTRVRHDLRSLVHAVLGYSDLLQADGYGQLNPEQARFVTHVRTAAEQLQELVDTCIELSRPSIESSALEPPRVQLGPALARFRNLLLEQPLTCELNLPPELARRQLSLDLTPLQRALRGLALVVTREGLFPCTLSVREQRPEGSTEPGQAIVCLSAREASRNEPLTCLDRLVDELGNRDFVRLKLAEVLLARQGVRLRIAATLDCVELELTLSCASGA